MNMESSQTQEIQQLLNHPYAILYEPILFASLHRSRSARSPVVPSSHIIPDSILSVSSFAPPRPAMGSSSLPLSRATTPIPTPTPSQSVSSAEQERILSQTSPPSLQIQIIPNVSAPVSTASASAHTTQLVPKSPKNMKRNAPESLSVVCEDKSKRTNFSNPKSNDSNSKSMTDSAASPTSNGDDSKSARGGADAVSASVSVSASASASVQVHRKPSTVVSKDRPSKQNFDAEWEFMFQQLVEYKKIHKHSFPPRECNEYPKLGRWLAFQRRRYREKSLLLSRKKKLDSVGVVWGEKPRQTARWMKMYQSLIEYKRDYHDTRVPQSQGKLGRWVHAQRVAFKNKTLSKDRIALLDAIEFIWDAHDKKYEYEDMLKYEMMFRQPTLCIPWKFLFESR